MLETIMNIFPYAIACTIPLLITALGGLFSERSGIVNIGLEGLMVIGAFSSAFSISILEKSVNPLLVPFIGIIIAAISGGVFSLLHAFASINLKADQVISGTAINMIASALTLFIARNVTGSGNIKIVHGFTRFDIPILSEIPILGKMLFTKVYASTIIVIIILVISIFVLYKTKFGLRLRACGENPHAADSNGIDVYKMRYKGVIISGACAGLGGAVMLTTYAGEFLGTVSGLGFLALASLIFGQWKPLGILGATMFFGFASTVANISQVSPTLQSMPPILLKTFPYVITLIALVLFSKKSCAPKALGEPFEKDKR